MVKADGCVAIHADGGAYKPLNWMNAPNTLVEEDDRWLVTNPKGEELDIRIDEIHSDVATRTGGRPPAWRRTASSPTCRSLLAAKPQVLEEGLELVRREYPTDDSDRWTSCAARPTGTPLSVEIKRRKGELDGVEQLTRYSRSAGQRLPSPSLAGNTGRGGHRPAGPSAGGVLRGIRCVEVDYEELRGIPSNNLRLF